MQHEVSMVYQKIMAIQRMQHKKTVYKTVTTTSCHMKLKWLILWGQTKYTTNKCGHISHCLGLSVVHRLTVSSQLQCLFLICSAIPCCFYLECPVPAWDLQSSVCITLLNRKQLTKTYKTMQ